MRIKAEDHPDSLNTIVLWNGIYIPNAVEVDTVEGWANVLNLDEWPAWMEEPPRYRIYGRIQLVPKPSGKTA